MHAIAWSTNILGAKLVYAAKHTVNCDEIVHCFAYLFHFRSVNMHIINYST